MRFSNVSSILAVAFSLAALPSAAIAQSTGLDDMVGARAGQAEGELQRRGYRNVGGENGDDRSYTYWWNADRRQCVTIATMEGRYSSITPSPAPDCRQSASVRPNPSYQGQPAARPRPGYEPDPSYGRPDPSGGQGDAINLVCVGQGEKLGSGYVNTLEWDRYDHKYRSRSGVQTEMKGFASAVTLQIYGNDGRIRLPEKLIPPINSGGDHQHWWQLDDIIVGSSEIRASYRLNGLNKPKIRIDRQSGVITIKGTGQDFSGRCDRVDPGQQRF